MNVLDWLITLRLNYIELRKEFCGYLKKNLNSVIPLVNKSKECRLHYFPKKLLQKIREGQHLFCIKLWNWQRHFPVCSQNTSARNPTTKCKLIKSWTFNLFLTCTHVAVRVNVNTGNSLKMELRRMALSLRLIIHRLETCLGFTTIVPHILVVYSCSRSFLNCDKPVCLTFRICFH